MSWLSGETRQKRERVRALHTGKLLRREAGTLEPAQLRSPIEERRIGAEHETYDSTISPFEADRYFANYAKRLRRDVTLDLGLTYQQIDYADIDNHLDLLTVTGSVVYRITPRLFLTGTVTWRDEQDDLRGPTRGLEEQLQINWYHRQTSFYGLIRNADLDSPFTDNSFQVFEIGIRREF